MAAQNNEQIAKSYFDAINRKDFDALEKLGSSDTEYVDIAMNQRLKGASVLRDVWQGWTQGFPDANLEIRQLISSGDFVVAECVAHGTHQGTFKSPIGDFPATGRKGDLPLCDVLHIKNGKIHSVHAYLDTYTMIRQMGIELGQRKAA